MAIWSITLIYSPSTIETYFAQILITQSSLSSLKATNSLAASVLMRSISSFVWVLKFSFSITDKVSSLALTTKRNLLSELNNYLRAAFARFYCFFKRKSFNVNNTYRPITKVASCHQFWSGETAIS